MSIQAYIMKKIIGFTVPTDDDFVIGRKKTDELGKRSSLPKNVKVIETCLDGIQCEWAYLENAPKDKVIIYLHGGGFCIGSIKSYRHFTTRLAKETGLRVLFVEYGLAPENPFPGALEESILVYKHLMSQGISPDNIVFAGDSAGAGLCLSMSLALRDRGESLPAALVLFSPWTDLTLTSDSLMTKQKKDPLVFFEDQKNLVAAYVNGTDVNNPLVSPVFGDYSDFPPMLIHTGTDEVLLDDSLNLAEKAKKDGAEVTLKLWEGMFHVFSIFPDYTPEGKKSFKEAVEFIRNKIEKNRLLTE